MALALVFGASLLAFALSAVSGDHDTLKKMLERAVEKDDFSTALYLDVAGPPLVEVSGASATSHET